MAVSLIRLERGSVAKTTGGSAAVEGEWVLCAEELDREELERFGRILDARPASLQGLTVGMALAEQLLRVRTREGWTAPLKANAVQRAFERRRGERNIVLKARQMGLTTWAAARFFLKTITQPGTLTLEVAHTQEAAEEIFRIVHRFLDWLPEELREGPLRTSQANVRQIVFPEMDAQYRVGRRPERGAGTDGAEPALLGAGALAGRSGRDAGGIAGGDGAGGGADSGIDAGRGRRLFPRGVAEGRRDGNGAALLPLVDGGAVPGQGGG
jgi:hypothetical protein